jgi:hypothetical protein
MVTSRKSAETPRSRRPPATTPEARENQLIAKAFDLAERQLEEGTASAAVITHYLKLGTARENLEREKLARENALLQARVENLDTVKNVEVLYQQALNAMRSYSGQEVEPEFDEE